MTLSRENQNKLDQLLKLVERESKQFIGYPCNVSFDYSEIFPFLSYPVNNVGDPYVPCNFHINTHDLEREVIDKFAELTGAGDDYWGYVTNGGTEGNMYGLYLARELHPEGVVYYSQDTHYSIPKILRILRMRNIMIRSKDNGEIDYEDLRETLRIKRDVTPIIVANIGTTMKGAIDDISEIKNIIEQLAIPDYYIHSDAALSGMILPFVKDAPGFGFNVGASSIAISGHKFIGSPIPCGIALARKVNVNSIARSIEYVGTLDTTLTGSRNGITPIFLWYALNSHNADYFGQIVLQCFDTADYAIQRLTEIGCTAWRNPFSITVVFERPSKALIERWQLASYQSFAHLILVPHITKAKVDRFVEDLKLEISA